MDDARQSNPAAGAQLHTLRSEWRRHLDALAALNPGADGEAPPPDVVAASYEHGQALVDLGTRMLALDKHPETVRWQRILLDQRERTQAALAILHGRLTQDGALSAEDTATYAALYERLDAINIRLTVGPGPIYPYYDPVRWPVWRNPQWPQAVAWFAEFIRGEVDAFYATATKYSGAEHGMEGLEGIAPDVLRRVSRAVADFLDDGLDNFRDAAWVWSADDYAAARQSAYELPAWADGEEVTDGPDA